jgi:hypothetical protein
LVVWPGFDHTVVFLSGIHGLFNFCGGGGGRGAPKGYWGVVILGLCTPASHAHFGKCVTELFQVPVLLMRPPAGIGEAMEGMVWDKWVGIVFVAYILYVTVQVLRRS